MCRKAILVLVVLSLAPVVSRSVAASDRPQNIILFGWDGAQRDHVKESLSRGELPNLRKLIEAGTLVDIDIEGNTDTKAGWAQILTGYYPEITGTYSNVQYQPIPKGLSIFERLKAHFGPEKFVAVAVISDSDNIGTVAPEKTLIQEEKPGSQASDKAAEGSKAAGGRAKQANEEKNEPQPNLLIEKGKKYSVIPGQPFYFTQDNMDLIENGLKENKRVGDRAIELLEKYKDKPFFFFVQFNEVEQAGLKHGENSKEYNDALISDDLWTGRIMSKVKELGLADKTQFYVTSAYGFNEGQTQHNAAPYTFLATNNKGASRNGRRQDVAPTIMEAFGLSPDDLKPALDGISMTKPDNRGPAKVNLEVRKPDVVYAAMPQKVVERLLEVAKVTKDDVVYDLGCGDGRIVVTAAKKYGCKAVGYDISPRRVRESLENVKKNHVEDLVTIEQKDIFTLDLSEASVITLYLLPAVNVKLIPQLDKLKPGSRIVAYRFGIRGVLPDQTVNFTLPGDNAQHTIYLWKLPLNKVWLWKNGVPPDRSGIK
jgi:hypothetical protein